MSDRPGASRLSIQTQQLFDGTRLLGPSTVQIGDGRILDVRSGAALPEEVHALVLPQDVVLAPGFVDLQVNGGGGALLNDVPTQAGVATIATAHRRLGTTALLPTLITDAPRSLAALVAHAQHILRVPGVAGLHIEGPFISQLRSGIHPKAHIRTLGPEDEEVLIELAKAGPLLVTLSPECVPTQVIARLVGRGIRVSAGHSEATGQQMAAAIDAGLTGITHLYNAMSQLTAREPGLVGTALASDRLFAGIICDGHHVSWPSFKAAYRAMGPQQLMLVSDAMPSVGTGPSTGTGLQSFDLLGTRITRAGDRLAGPDGTLAGAHLDMATAVARAVASGGVPLASALMMATSTPARFMGLEGTLGHIAQGRAADLVAIGANGQRLVGVWAYGIAQLQP